MTTNRTAAAGVSLFIGLLYPEMVLKGWLAAQWKRFNDRIFDVSELMRNVQAAFARFYNRTFGPAPSSAACRNRDAHRHH